METHKNETCKCNLGNKEQKAMFSVVSRSDVHFSFEHTFFPCPIGRASKFTRPKNPKKKFVHPCNNSLFSFDTSSIIWLRKSLLSIELFGDLYTQIINKMVMSFNTILQQLHSFNLV